MATVANADKVAPFSAQQGGEADGKATEASTTGGSHVSPAPCADEAIRTAIFKAVSHCHGSDVHGSMPRLHSLHTKINRIRKKQSTIRGVPLARHRGTAITSTDTRP